MTKKTIYEASPQSAKAVIIVGQVLSIGLPTLENPSEAVIETDATMTMLERVTTLTLFSLSGGDARIANGFLDALQHRVSARLMTAESGAA